MKRRTFLFALTATAIAPIARAQSKPLKIGIIGSGRIGSTFGGLWAKAGHEIMFSDRDPENAKRAAEAVGSRARAGSVEEAVAFGDAVLIAVPYGALPAIAQQVGEKLKGKVVIDPNNPVPARDGELGAQAKEKGAAVSTAALLPGARAPLVVHLLLLPARELLHPAAAARRDGRRRRRAQPAVALHRHLRRHAGGGAALRRAGGAAAAPALHSVRLPLLRREPRHLL